MNDTERKKCNRCKVNLILTNFTKKRDDTYMKTCNNCKNTVKLYREKSKCEHGRDKYLECNIRDYKIYIEEKFQDGMCWDNYGSEWHIDHIIPLQYKNPTLEQVVERIHYTNTQPLWKEENLSKGNRYIG